jgi:hypothetical protein
VKKNFIIHAAFLFLIISCNKSVDKKVENTEGSIIQTIFIDPIADSMTTNYLYDDEDYLIKVSEVEFHSVDGIVSYPNDIEEYTRDEEKRVIKKTHLVDHDTLELMNVYYQNADVIAYVIDYVTRGTSKVTDSLTYEYSNGKVKRINTFPLQTITSEQPSYYETYEYAGANISQIRSFYLNNDRAYREGDRRDFEYDDKINPFFKHDESFFNLPANNVIKETITYGNPVPDPKGDITTEYTYGSDNKPISSESTHAVPVVAFVTKTLYYYK